MNATILLTNIKWEKGAGRQPKTMEVDVDVEDYPIDKFALMDAAMDEASNLRGWCIESCRPFVQFDDAGLIAWE